MIALMMAGKTAMAWFILCHDLRSDLAGTLLGERIAAMVSPGCNKRSHDRVYGSKESVRVKMNA